MDACVHLIRDVIEMNYKHFGELLRELRETRNMTREQLALGICTPKQIYRLEKGVYEPSLYLLNQLSMKFNVDLNNYFKMFLSNKSGIAFDGIKEINKAVEKNDVITLKNLINEYENLPEFMHGENKQHILYGKALCESLMNQNYQQSFQYCMEGLRIENPDFSLDAIREGVYSNVGLALLNCVSRNYMALNKLNEGIKVLIDMLYIIEHFILTPPYAIYKASEFSKNIYLNTIYNLCAYLLRTKKIAESLTYVNKGINFSLKEYNLRFLPELLTMKFRLLYSMENFAEAKEYYDQAKNLLKITQQEKMALDVDELVMKEYPLLLDK